MIEHNDVQIDVTTFSVKLDPKQSHEEVEDDPAIHEFTADEGSIRVIPTIQP